MNGRRALKQLLWHASPGLYRRTQGRARQEFAIGMVAGNSPFSLKPAASVVNPVLSREHVTDVPATLVADPFMCQHRDRWYLFFEVVNHLTRKGEIGLAVSNDALHWKYRQIVLAEPFHLSYPYVFEWRGEHFMIPESARGGTVSLYRAADFPERWVRVATLLEGNRYADSSIFHYHEHWWLFTDAGTNAHCPILRLYYAREPFGPWREHPSSPILNGNPHVARPGGRVIFIDDTPVRFAQDVYPIYGSRVHAFLVTRLTPSDYEERPATDEAVLSAGREPWNCDGMHHIDAHQRADASWIACVDGFRAYGAAAERPVTSLPPERSA